MKLKNRFSKKLTIKKQFRKGFTIIELSISNVFLALLILAIVTLIMYATSLYQKGLSIRAVNNVSLELIDEFTRTISSSYNAAESSDYNFNKSFFQASGTATLNRAGGETIENAPTWGFFCSGTYTYVWRTGYVAGGGYYSVTMNETNAPTDVRLFSYTIDPTTNEIRYGGLAASGFRLLRLYDPGRDICVNAYDGTRNNGHNAFTTGIIYAPSDAYSGSREFFSTASEDSLVLYDLRIYPPTYHYLTGHTYFPGSFVLGTLRGSVNIMSSEDTCREKSDGLSTDFAYCAINKFNFAIRATGGSS